MSIVIERILAVTEKGVRATVLHGQEMLDVEVAAPNERATATLGESLNVEVGFAEVVAWRILETDDPMRHGFFQAGPASVRIVGKVHGITQVDDATSLFDLYSQAGPEFVSFETKDVHGAPPVVGDGVEAVVSGLCFYPTST
jgi:hypothetical protein